MTCSALINYLMCGLVTFALHWHTLDDFRREAAHPHYRAMFFVVTVSLCPATIFMSTARRDWGTE